MPFSLTFCPSLVLGLRCARSIVWGIGLTLAFHAPCQAQASTNDNTKANTSNPSPAPLVLLAAPVLRPEIIKSLQAAQDAMKAGQLVVALSLAQQTLTLPGITPEEKPVIQRTLAGVALQMKNYDLAISTLESVLQDMPDTVPVPQRTQLIESLLSVCQQAQDFERFVQWSRVYLELEGTNATVRPVYIQTLALLKMHKEVVAEINIKMKLDQAAQLKTPENELRMLAISQRQLKDDAGYNDTLKRLLVDYPSKAYWSEMIARLARQASFNARYDLDLYRLLELTGNMEEANEYMDMANIALKNGLPAEAARVMAQAEAQGLLGKGPDAVMHQKLKIEVKQKVAEDEKALPALERSAKDANTIASLAEVYAAKQQWDAAMASYNKALAMGGLRREAEIKLHAGWAHFKAGQKAPAIQLWDSIKDDATAMSLAQLCKIWATTH